MDRNKQKLELQVATGSRGFLNVEVDADTTIGELRKQHGLATLVPELEKASPLESSKTIGDEYQELGIQGKMCVRELIGAVGGYSNR